MQNIGYVAKCDKKTSQKSGNCCCEKKFNTPQNEDNQSIDANSKCAEISKKYDFSL